MTGFVVTYTVGDREFKAGPYDSYWVAEEHRRDIVGYEGVHSSRTDPVPAEGS